MICPHCGADNPDNSQYCSLCLGFLAQETPTESSDTYDTIGVDDMIPSWEATPAPEIAPDAASSAPLDKLAPASDVYASRQYAPYQRTPSSVPKPKTKEIIIFASVFALIAVLALAGFLVVPSVFGKKTFTSPASGLSFKYPGGWEDLQMSADQISQLSGIDVGDIPLKIDTVLADSTSTDVKSVLTVSTATTSAGGADWPTIKNQVEQNLGGVTAMQAAQGISYTPKSLEEIHVDGKQGLRFAYDAAAGNMQCKADGAIILDGETINYVVLVGLNGTDSEETFQKILDSMKFK
ncbi:MAG: zinc ribbon domain-containing protein [Actinobacteria bacterium]|nr:zinc ribbon domain-containing protein [Actinomycetota bacterium]